MSDEIDIYDISRKDVVDGVNTVNIETAKLKHYDLIICSNVLEHIPYPKKTLDEIKMVMKDECILYVEIPYEKIVRDFKNPMEVLFKKKHWHEHINFFNETSIKRLVSLCDYEIIKMKALKINNFDDSVLQLALKCTEKIK